MIKMIIDGKINGKQAKEILEHMMDTGKDANTLVSELGMTQISNEEYIKSNCKKGFPIHYSLFKSSSVKLSFACPVILTGPISFVVSSLWYNIWLSKLG